MAFARLLTSKEALKVANLLKYPSRGTGESGQKSGERLLSCVMMAQFSPTRLMHSKSERQMFSSLLAGSSADIRHQQLGFQDKQNNHLQPRHLMLSSKGRHCVFVRTHYPSSYTMYPKGFSENGHSNGASLGEVPLNLGVGLIPPKPLAEKAENQAYARELHTVTVAICANVVIFAAKLITFLFSGSSTMLAETVHSVVDTFNQVLLRFGIVRSRKAPTTRHPYGYLKDKFVWSLVSAVGIFCLGAGITTAHGFSSLLAPPQALENLGYGMSVLGVSFLVEGYSLVVATRSVLHGAQAAGLSFFEYLRRGMDPTSIAVMMEDGAAVAGLAIAGASMAISHSTGNSMYDAIGSIAIGLLLGCTALFLISQNRSLLIGRSMQDSDMQKVMDLLRKDSVVKAVHDAKSEEIGPAIYRFKAEIEFKGDRLVQRHMDRLGGVERLHEQIYSAVITKKRESLDMALVAYGNDMIGALGAEIDRLENEIRQLVPGIRHIDLETDRGRRDVGAPLSNGLYSVDAEPQR